MNEAEKSKPSNYGFDLDFDDLASVKPIAAPRGPKPALTKTASATDNQQITNPVSKVMAEPAVVAPKLKKPAARKTKPKLPKPKLEAARSDEVAKSMGFKAREPQGTVLKKRRRTNHDEPVDQLSIRGPVRILNDFIDHCDQHNLAYWEALEQLLENT